MPMLVRQFDEQESNQRPAAHVETAPALFGFQHPYLIGYGAHTTPGQFDAAGNHLHGSASSDPASVSAAIENSPCCKGLSTITSSTAGRSSARVTADDPMTRSG